MDDIMEKYEKAKEYFYFIAAMTIAVIFFLAEIIPHTINFQWMEVWFWQESIADKMPTWINNAIYVINTRYTKGIALPLSLLSVGYLFWFSECETRWKTVCNTILVLSMLAAIAQLATSIHSFSLFG